MALGAIPRIPSNNHPCHAQAQVQAALKLPVKSEFCLTIKSTSAVILPLPPPPTADMARGPQAGGKSMRKTSLATSHSHGSTGNTQIESGNYYRYWCSRSGNGPDWDCSYMPVQKL